MDNPVGLSDNKMKAIALALAEQEENFIELLDTQKKEFQEQHDKSFLVIEKLTDALDKSTFEIDSLQTKIKNIKLNHGVDGLDGLPGADVDQEALEKSAIDYIDSLELKSGTDGKDAVAYDGVDGQDGRDGLGFDALSWNEGVYRKGSVVCHNIGQYFEAVEDTAKEPSHSKTWKRLGSSGFRQTGGYKKDFKYQNGDMFTRDFSTFMFQNNKEFLLAARSKAIPGPKGDDIAVMKEIGEIKAEMLDMLGMIATLNEDMKK